MSLAGSLRNISKVAVSDNTSLCAETNGNPPPYEDVDDVEKKILSDLPVREIVPDGGWGWVVMLGSFGAQFLTGCIVYVQGIFYPAFLDSFGQSKVATSWVCSMQTCLWLTGSIIGGPLIEVIGCKRLCMIGAILVFLGEILSAFSPNLWVLYLTYGILCGFGLSFIFFPSIVIVQRYFDKKRALAHSIANSGVSFGYFAMPPLLQELIKAYTWRGALLIVAAIILHVFVIAFLYRPLPKYKSLVDRKGFSTAVAQSLTSIATIGKSRSKILEFMKKLCDFSLWRNPVLALDVIGYFLFNFGFIVPPMFLPLKAKHYGIEGALPALLISIMGVSDLLGRYVAGFFGVCLSNRRIVMYFLSMILCGSFSSISSVFTDFWLLAIYASLFGLTTGIARAINSVITTDLMGVANLPKAYGYKLFFAGLAVLASAPIAAQIFTKTNSYNAPFFIIGLIQVAGGLVVFLLYILREYHFIK